MNKFLTYAVMLNLLRVVYVQFIIMLTELKEVLSQELKCFCLCSETITVLSD